MVRRFARRADPVLLPTAALLAGLGYAMISGSTRIWPPSSSRGWFGLRGVLTLSLVRDDRMLDAYTYTIGLAGLVLLLLPIVPGLGRTINGARLWVASDPSRSSPRSSARC